MITVKSPSSKQYQGLEEKKHHHHLPQKSESNTSKSLNPLHQSQQQPSFHSKEQDLNKKVQLFQSTLLSVKGSDVISQAKLPFNQSEGKLQPLSKEMSSLSTNLLSSLTSKASRNRYENNDQHHQKRLRRIVKNFQGQRIDNQVEKQQNFNDSVFQSVYNSDFHKNFIKNSALLSLPKQSQFDSPMSHIQSFIGLSEGVNQNNSIKNNETINTTHTKSSLNMLKKSIQENNYDQVVNDMLKTQRVAKRSQSNKILKKNYLNPLRREEQQSCIEQNRGKLNNSILNEKQKQKMRSMSQEQQLQLPLDRVYENAVEISQLEKDQQNLKEVQDEQEYEKEEQMDDFDHLLSEIKQEEDKYSPINNDDVITEYQLTMNTLKHSLLQDKSSQNKSTESYNISQPQLTHEQEIIQQLIQTQPQYFDHKAGRCLCSICTCGFCINKCKQISEHLDTNQKQNWISTYRQQYKQKQNRLDSTKSIDSLNQLKMQYKSSLDSCPELFCSTSKNDYKQRQPLDEPYKISQKIFIKNEAPFSQLSSYSSQYVNWGVQPFNMIKQSQQKTVLDKLPFSHLTTYEDSFRKKCDTLPSQLIVPKNMNPLPNIGMFLGESTSKRSFNEKTNNFFSLPKKIPQNPPILIPSYNGQFKTETSKAYEGNVEKCKAREVLRKQFLDKIQLKQQQNKKDYLASLNNI